MAEKKDCLLYPIEIHGWLPPIFQTFELSIPFRNVIHCAVLL